MPTALVSDALGYAECDPDLRPPQTTLLTVLPQSQCNPATAALASLAIRDP